MRVLDLPKYFEGEGLTAWRDSYAHRTWGYPYIMYKIKSSGRLIVIEARGSTDLLKFEGPLEALGFKTFGALATHVALHGHTMGDGFFKGAYVLPCKEITIVLDPLIGENLDFLFIAGGEELMLSVPPQEKIRKLFRLLRFLHRVWKKEGA